jgi:hypothetical protein
MKACIVKRSLRTPYVRKENNNGPLIRNTLNLPQRYKQTLTFLKKQTTRKYRINSCFSFENNKMINTFLNNPCHDNLEKYYYTKQMAPTSVVLSKKEKMTMSFEDLMLAKLKNSGKYNHKNENNAGKSDIRSPKNSSNRCSSNATTLAKKQFNPLLLCKQWLSSGQPCTD